MATEGNVGPSTVVQEDRYLSPPNRLTARTRPSFPLPTSYITVDIPRISAPNDFMLLSRDLSMRRHGFATTAGPEDVSISTLQPISAKETIDDFGTDTGTLTMGFTSTVSSITTTSKDPVTSHLAGKEPPVSSSTSTTQSGSGSAPSSTSTIPGTLTLTPSGTSTPSKSHLSLPLVVALPVAICVCFVICLTAIWLVRSARRRRRRRATGGSPSTGLSTSKEVPGPAATFSIKRFGRARRPGGSPRVHDLHMEEARASDDLPESRRRGLWSLRDSHCLGRDSIQAHDGSRGSPSNEGAADDLKAGLAEPERERQNRQMQADESRAETAQRFSGPSGRFAQGLLPVGNVGRGPPAVPLTTLRPVAQEPVLFDHGPIVSLALPLGIAERMMAFLETHSSAEPGPTAVCEADSMPPPAYAPRPT